MISKKIFFLVMNLAGPTWYRCQVPAEGLRQKGHQVAFSTSINPFAVADFDILVIQREFTSMAEVVINTAKQNGVKTIYDIDDDLFNLDQTHPAFEFWSKNKYRQGVIDCIKRCDCLTVTTERLSKKMSGYNQNIFILPNMLPGKYWNEVVDYKVKDKIIIGWGGGISHCKDLEYITKPIIEILGKYPQLEAHFSGMEKYPFPEHERIIFIDTMNMSEYNKMLVKFDIGIAPLADIEFNKSKSDLKFLEYAMAGLPVVASDSEAYNKTIIHGENGLLAKSEDEWVEYLSMLIEDIELRKKVGHAAKNYAETRTIEKNVHMWEEAYGLKTDN